MKPGRCLKTATSSVRKGYLKVKATDKHGLDLQGPVCRFFLESTCIQKSFVNS